MNTQSSFKDLVAANRRGGRLAEPVDTPKAPAPMLAGMRLLPNELAQAKVLAQGEDRSVSNFLRRVYLRGLASYLAEHGGTAAAQQ